MSVKGYMVTTVTVTVYGLGAEVPSAPFALLPLGFDVQVYTQNVFGIYDGPAAAGIGSSSTQLPISMTHIFSLNSTFVIFSFVFVKSASDLSFCGAWQEKQIPQNRSVSKVFVFICRISLV